MLDPPTASGPSCRHLQTRTKRTNRRDLAAVARSIPGTIGRQIPSTALRVAIFGAIVHDDRDGFEAKCLADLIDDVAPVAGRNAFGRV